LIEVVLGVTDEGIRYSHPLLSRNQNVIEEPGSRQYSS
jgi:hypothetical protein